MEEADLLKERLQAITDKRRIQEDIAKKRRLIEEEKLKLQYIKKKALREQWLMDGLSQQSEQEQEAMRLQAQDEQQQSDELQSNILRIEKEIQELEAQELDISANEEVVLRRLKEVERTAEDIIKELNAELQADVTHHVPSPLPDISSFIPLTTAKSPSVCKPGSEEQKKATFAMEISVEHDKRTGKSQVISMASITPETVQGRGLKVYDDGRKSVYALHPGGGGGLGEMTPTEVDELLRQATDAPTEVQYHQPVYSAPYTGSSRPSTPRTPSKTPAPSPGPPLQTATSSRQGEETWSDPAQQDSEARVHGSDEEAVPGQSRSDQRLTPQPESSAPWGPDPSGPTLPALVSVKARAEGTPTPIQSVHRAPGSPGSPSQALGDSDIASLNAANGLPESQPVTMIFMGYENAEDEGEEDIRAELVVIGNSDDEDNGDEDLSYHPEGCRSRVFRPTVGSAKVVARGGLAEDAHAGWGDTKLHRPTFTHRKRGSRLGSGESVSAETAKLCSTGR